MIHILSKNAASITELKSNPSELINNTREGAIAILNRNTPTAYLLSPELFEKLIDAFDDLELIKTVKTRRKDLNKAVKVNIDDL